MLGEGKSAFVLFYKQQRRFLEHFLNKFLKWIKKSCFLKSRGVFYFHLSEMRYSVLKAKKEKNVFFCIGRREETIMRKMVRGLFVLAAMTAALTMVACSGKKAETTAAAESKMETEAAKESVKADEKDAKETTAAAEKKDDKKDDKKDAKETTAAAEESESTEESSK